MLSKILKPIFGTRNDRVLKSMRIQIEAVKAAQSHLTGIPDENLRALTQSFKSRFQEGQSLESLLPEAFALVREASTRVFGKSHYDVQMLGALVMNSGNIAEMRTGEGKTLTATLTAYLNALPGRGVHVVTANDYLAERDAQIMRPLYEFLGLTVGINLPSLSQAQKKAAYAADITYSTSNEIGFDYLRDNMVFNPSERVHRELHFAIIDEIDSILIDEARTPLIVTAPSTEHTHLYARLNSAVQSLRRCKHPNDERGHFVVDEKTYQIHLTELGMAHVEALFAAMNPNSSGGLYDHENIMFVHHSIAALRAHHLYLRDKDYVVQNDEIIIVDEHTGRMMPGRRWGEGLHQAVEAKEGLTIQPENQTMATVTVQNFFRMYNRLCGMTGTADTESIEFAEIYGLETVVIPPNRPNQRKDQLDLVFRTAEEKYAAAIEDIKQAHLHGQPVLVGTSSIENSELISSLLTQENLPHQVLNAKLHGREAGIIAQAGRKGMITIATNMAGRGTDIILGGNIEAEIEAVEHDESLNELVKANIIEKIQADWKQAQQEVVALGGLRVIATERHESRRVDNQLRGRSGRQGDPGSSQFYLSLEDPLMRVFASDFIVTLVDRLKIPHGQPLEFGLISRAIESAQRSSEGKHYEVRKQLIEYDVVITEQRKVIYDQRKILLDDADLSEQIAHLREGSITDLVESFVPANSFEEQWDLKGLSNRLSADFELSVDFQPMFEGAATLESEDILTAVLQAAQDKHAAQIQAIGADRFKQLEKVVLLQSLDRHWRGHLSMLDVLQESVHLRAIAQKKPVQEFKREAFETFSIMLDAVRDEVTSILLKIHYEQPEPVLVEAAA